MLGTVTTLRRYPVKSMLGENLDAADVSRSGLARDQRAHLERYRPNVVIRTDAGGFTENDWLGQDLRIGDVVVLRVIARTPRCAVPTLAHGDLPRDTEALRVLARHNRVRPMPESDPEPCAGVYAEVLQPGRIHTGDSVRLALS
jgi:uncharacterized protein